MPTYEYICNTCSEKFEEFQSMKSEPIANCPKCGATSKRLFSLGGGIIFKGQGFYVNDYKAKKPETCTSTPAAPKTEACSTCPAAQTSAT